MAMIDYEALTLWRERSGLSKTALAKATNISLQYLCDIEGGKRKLNRRPELIKRFAEALEIPVTYLERR